MHLLSEEITPHKSFIIVIVLLLTKGNRMMPKDCTYGQRFQSWLPLLVLVGYLTCFLSSACGVLSTGDEKTGR